MKRVVLSSVLMLASVTMVSAFEPTGWRKAGLELVRAEKQVVEAIWTQDISLWVSVIDDGNDRSPFAEYVCVLLRDAGRTQTAVDFVIVKVFDIAAMRAGEMVELGKAICQTE